LDELGSPSSARGSGKGGKRATHGNKISNFHLILENRMHQICLMTLFKYILSIKIISLHTFNSTSGGQRDQVVGLAHQGLNQSIAHKT